MAWTPLRFSRQPRGFAVCSVTTLSADFAILEFGKDDFSRNPVS